MDRIKDLIPETMIRCMVKEIQDGKTVLHGLSSPLPILAINLAKETHAPNMVYLGAVEGLDPKIERLTISSADPRMMKSTMAYVELMETFDLAQKNKLDIMFLGGAQIDKYGNTNLSVIGDYYKPKIRLPGGAATAFLMPLVGKVVLWSVRHNKRTIVDKVDFRTGQGYLEGSDSREKLALRKIEIKLVTNLGVFGFDAKTKIMNVESLHPWATIEDVKNNTGFPDLITPEEIQKTEIPTEEELKIIRRLDPDGVRFIEFK